MSDIDFMFSLVCNMLCLVRNLVLVNFYMLHYSYVFSSMMLVHPKDGGSAWDTRVLLASVDMVSGLVKCCWMSPFPTVCRGSLQVVTALFSAIVILHIQLGGRRFIKYCDEQDNFIYSHERSSNSI